MGTGKPLLVHCRQDLTEVAGNMETEKYIQKSVILRLPNYSLVEGQQPPMTTSTLQNHIHKIIQKGVNQTNCPFSVDRWAQKKAVVREWTYLSLDQTSLTALWEVPVLQIQQTRWFGSLHEESEMLYSRITHKPTVLLTHPNHPEILFPCQVFLLQWQATKHLSSTTLKWICRSPGTWTCYHSQQLCL